MDKKRLIFKKLRIKKAHFKGPFLQKIISLQEIEGSENTPLVGAVDVKIISLQEIEGSENLLKQTKMVYEIISLQEIEGSENFFSQ